MNIIQKLFQPQSLGLGLEKRCKKASTLRLLQLGLRFFFHSFEGWVGTKRVLLGGCSRAMGCSRVAPHQPSTPTPCVKGSWGKAGGSSWSRPLSEGLDNPEDAGVATYSGAKYRKKVCSLIDIIQEVAALNQ